MTKVLISGGAGFIGSSLAEALLKKGNYHVVIIDNLLTGKMDNLPKNSDKFEFIKGDVNKYKDISAIMLTHNFDYVFHYAAVVGVERTLSEPMLVLNDIEGIKNILDLSKNTGVKRIFFSSSSEVYGEPVESPQNEESTPLNSRLPYAIVKNLGETFLRSYHQEYGLDYTVFRFFNTYGPKQSKDFVMSVFLDRALKGKTLEVVGDGEQTRTFCYIGDNIEATINCMEQSKYVNQVVNIGSDFEVTIKQLAEKIVEITGSDSKIVHIESRKEGDMRRRKPDIKKMMELLKENMTTIDEGVREIISEWEK